MFPWIYYLVSVGLLAILLNQCRPENIARGASNPTRADALFLGLSLLLVTFMRLPGLLYNNELNPDESKTLAGAITLAQDPIFGRSVDGTTLGPINNYLLLLPHKLGLPLDYTTARLVGLLLILASLVFFYRSLRRVVSQLVSRLTFLSTVLFFGWATNNDFLHYSSELTSLLILTICFDAAVQQLQATDVSGSLLARIGIVAGLTPYCKLQSVPIIGVLLGTLLVYLILTHRQKALRPVAILSAGFLLLSLLVFGLAGWFHVVPYFVDYYFVGSLSTYQQIYADTPLVSQGFGIKLLHFPRFLASFSDVVLFSTFNCFLALAAFVWAGLRYGWLGRPSPTTARIALLVVLTALATLWAVVTPGTEFGHHLLLLLFPVGWLTALALEYGVCRPSLKNQRVGSPVLFANVTTLLLLAEVVLSDNLLFPYMTYRIGQPLLTDEWQRREHLQNWQMKQHPTLFSFPDERHLTPLRVSEVIRPYFTGSDRLVVWGWNCRPHVETGRAQGTSDSDCQRTVIPNPMQTRYLTRYARELEVNRPVLFLDAVGSSSLKLTKSNQRHEYFPLINRIIRKQYCFIGLVDDVRIYVRRDRLSSQGVSMNQPTP